MILTKFQLEDNLGKVRFSKDFPGSQHQCKSKPQNILLTLSNVDGTCAKEKAYLTGSSKVSNPIAISIDNNKIVGDSESSEPNLS